MAVLFDGVDDFINVGDPANGSLDFGLGDMAIGAWINLTDVTSRRQIVSKDTNTLQGLYYFEVNTDGTLRTFIGSVGNNRGTQSTATVNDGNWHHVLMNVDRADEVNIYIDGVLDIGGGVWVSGGNYADIDLDGTNVLYIGNNARIAAADYSGQITEVSICGAALSAPQRDMISRSRVKHTPLNINPATLASYWPMDDVPHGLSCDGKTFIDMSANANNGTGDDGGNNTGLTSEAEQVLSYSPYIMTPQSFAVAAAPSELVAERGLFRGINRGINRGVA